MADRFESLENGEVISVQHDIQVLSGHRTFRVGEVSEAIKAHLEQAISNWNQSDNGWFSPQGIDCEALRFGSQGWQKGRIRLCLEFCPDEPNSPAHSIAASIPTPTAISATTEPMGQAISPPPTAISATTEPMGVAVSLVSTPPTPFPPTVHENSVEISSDISLEQTTTHDTHAAGASPSETPTTEADTTIHSSDAFAAIPVAGIATIGAVVATIAAPALPETIANLAPHAETTLELEQPTDLGTNSGGFDEIAFDFDLADKDRGVMIPNGMMELDLADLGLDFSEHDLLSFEENGMFTPSTEFINLQDLDRSENSGMLIDEVWNEMNQGNWPGIN
jgi:KGK domain